MKYKFDVVIPCVGTDIKTLGLCVQSIRENVTNTVGNIFVIGNPNGSLENYCKYIGCIFRDEIKLMGFGKEDLNGIPFGRNGWLYQQLLKLSGDKVSDTEDFLICDADHLLLKPHKFIDDGVYQFYYSGEYHIPYFRTIKLLFGNGYGKCCNVSFISEKMIFNSIILSEMKTDIERNCDLGWVESIVKYYDKETISGFSEFETYGTYIYTNYRDKVNLIDAKKTGIRYKEEDKNKDLDSYKDEYKDSLSVTFLK